MKAIRSAGGLFIVAAVAALTAGSHRDALAAPPPSEWQPNAMEQRQLPAVCQGAFNKQLQNQPGYSITGCGGHFNHYCPGLVALQRAEQVSLPKADRLFYKKNAGGHLQYTRRYMPATCPLAENLRAAEFRLKMLDITLK